MDAAPPTATSTTEAFPCSTLERIGGEGRGGSCLARVETHARRACRGAAAAAAAAAACMQRAKVHTPGLSVLLRSRAVRGYYRRLDIGAEEKRYTSNGEGDRDASNTTKNGVWPAPAAPSSSSCPLCVRACVRACCTAKPRMGLGRIGSDRNGTDHCVKAWVCVCILRLHRGGKAELLAARRASSAAADGGGSDGDGDGDGDDDDDDDDGDGAACASDRPHHCHNTP